MIIDIFKDSGLYQTVHQHTPQLLEVLHKHPYVSDRDYYTLFGESSSTFAPAEVRHIALSHTYPNTIPVQQDKRLCLNLTACNYTSMLVINKLYSDKKNILIEDIGAGACKFIFYLAKLGFDNWHIIDNLSQVSPDLMRDVCIAANIKPLLNSRDRKPVVFNRVGQPYIQTYDNFSSYENAELYCVYNNWKTIELLQESWRSDITLKANKKYPQRIFKLLCKDVYDMTHVFCIESKLDEFRDKLRDIDIEYSEPSVPEPEVPEPSVPEPSVPEPSVPEPENHQPGIPEGTSGDKRGYRKYTHYR